ncbi:hypothetical protein Vretimale_14036 [Volvox reticuliferus]|uniref:Uncharacterized protein n=1 Tax=Volvox reticuliferus TaxID=1737510 RepID=A0A8J4CZ83_9CHLO|nr:hypothetical protein Vretifemale_20091 [Volvox reticuliferus]GIM10497.1 hypothetical protein Vretimale_14036 [Volvox reticuliferus]
MAEIAHGRILADVVLADIADTDSGFAVMLATVWWIIVLVTCIYAIVRYNVVSDKWFYQRLFLAYAFARGMAASLLLWLMSTRVDGPAGLSINITVTILMATYAAALIFQALMLAIACGYCISRRDLGPRKPFAMFFFVLVAVADAASRVSTFRLITMPTDDGNGSSDDSPKAMAAKWDARLWIVYVFAVISSWLYVMVVVVMDCKRLAARNKRRGVELEQRPSQRIQVIYTAGGGIAGGALGALMLILVSALFNACVESWRRRRAERNQSSSTSIGNTGRRERSPQHQQHQQRATISLVGGSSNLSNCSISSPLMAASEASRDGGEETYQGDHQLETTALLAHHHRHEEGLAAVPSPPAVPIRTRVVLSDTVLAAGDGGSGLIGGVTVASADNDDDDVDEDGYAHVHISVVVADVRRHALLSDCMGLLMLIALSYIFVFLSPLLDDDEDPTFGIRMAQVVNGIFNICIVSMALMAFRPTRADRVIGHSTFLATVPAEPDRV